MRRSASFGATRCDVLPLLSFREVNAGHGRTQCLPNSALRERNPTDPAMTEADAEPSRVKVQADKRRKVNLLPDVYLHESLFALKQCEILFGYHEVLRRTCAFNGSQDSLVNQGSEDRDRFDPRSPTPNWSVDRTGAAG